MTNTQWVGLVAALAIVAYLGYVHRSLKEDVRRALIRWEDDAH